MEKHTPDKSGKKGSIFWITTVVFAALWLLGFATSYTLVGFIQVLLVIAIVAILIKFIWDRRS
jgi:hypothetical protein